MLAPFPPKRPPVAPALGPLAPRPNSPPPVAGAAPKRPVFGAVVFPKSEPGLLVKLLLFTLPVKLLPNRPPDDGSFFG